MTRRQITLIADIQRTKIASSVTSAIEDWLSTTIKRIILDGATGDFGIIKLHSCPANSSALRYKRVIDSGLRPPETRN